MTAKLTQPSLVSYNVKSLLEVAKYILSCIIHLLVNQFNKLQKANEVGLSFAEALLIFPQRLRSLIFFLLFFSLILDRINSPSTESSEKQPSEGRLG